MDENKTYTTRERVEMLLEMAKGHQLVVDMAKKQVEQLQVLCLHPENAWRCTGNTHTKDYYQCSLCLLEKTI